MRIYANRLAQETQKGALPNVILVFGDEPYQQQQALDQIRTAAREQGVEERIRFTLDSEFKWRSILDEAMALSLFASRKLIELEMPAVKPGREGGKILQEWAALDNNDHILVLWGPKLGADQSKAKWFKVLDKAGWYIPLYEIERQNLPGWFQQDLREQGLQAEPDALALLCEMFEGNLLSAAQEVTRLALLYPQQKLTLEQIKTAVSDQSRFNVFQLSDDILTGQFDKALRILNRLAGEEVEPVLIAWALQKEADLINQIQSAQQQGESFDMVCKRLRIWDKRKNLYRTACARIPQTVVMQIIDSLGFFDRQYKSNQLKFPYVQLSHCLMLFSGNPELIQFNQQMLEAEVD